VSFLIEKYAFRDGCCDVAQADADNVVVEGPCYSCQEKQQVTVKQADLSRFQAGEFAQNCFPYLSAPAREFLISGICDECWNDMFPPEDEDECDLE
jgi:hypothetical protein